MSSCGALATASDAVCVRCGPQLRRMDGYVAKPATQRDLLAALQQHGVPAPASPDDPLVVMIENA